MTGATNRRRGILAERDLVRWLRANGWPQAERAVVTGHRSGDRERRDGGDITSTVGIVWSVKDQAEERIPRWWAELEAMDGDGVRLLVVKRRGHANPGEWWCWLTIAQLFDLADTSQPPADGLVRLELDAAACILRRAGYGQLQEQDKEAS